MELPLLLRALELLEDLLLRLLLETLLLLDELLRLLLLDTLLLLVELLLDTLVFFEDVLVERELDDDELLRTVLEVPERNELAEPEDLFSLFTALLVFVRRVVPVALLLRVEVPTLLVVLLRRVAVDEPTRSAEVLRPPALFFTLSVRLELVRTGVLEVTAVR